MKFDTAYSRLLSETTDSSLKKEDFSYFTITFPQDEYRTKAKIAYFKTKDAAQKFANTLNDEINAIQTTKDINAVVPMLKYITLIKATEGDYWLRDTISIRSLGIRFLGMNKDPYRNKFTVEETKLQFLD